MPLLTSKHERSLLLPWLPSSPNSSAHPLLVQSHQWLLASANTTSNGGNGQHRKPCLLCQCRRSNFYCQDCVRKGEFTHSNPRRPEDLAEKQLRALHLERVIREFAQKIKERQCNALRAKELVEKISGCRQRIKYLNYLVKDKREKVTKVKELEQKLRLVNQRRLARLPKFQHKVDQISCASSSYQRELNRDRSRFNEEEKDLALLRRKYATELTTYIFPVTEVFPEEQDKDKDVEMITDSLADAIQTSFINGRWVMTTETSGEMQFKIVEPLMSSGGDYSAYHAWNVALKDNVIEQQQITDLNPAFTISAGLMFTTQLVQHLASIFEVVLPKRINYQDFGALMASEYRFSRKVTMLNLNVIYLCLSQGVAPDRLRPKDTLHDLKLLLDAIYESSVHVGRSFQSFRETKCLYEMSLLLHDELDKVPITSDDLNDVEDEEDGYMTRFEHEGDWDSLNDDLTTAQWENAPSSNAGSSSTTPSSSSAYSASSFVSSIWRGLTS